jgi:hypothetical protein
LHTHHVPVCYSCAAPTVHNVAGLRVLAGSELALRAGCAKHIQHCYIRLDVSTVAAMAMATPKQGGGCCKDVLL